MRICFIYQGAALWACERAEKMAGALSAAGHETFLLCNGEGEGEEKLGQLRVLRLRPPIANPALSRLVKTPYFFNPVWVRGLKSVVQQFGIEALHVIDVPLAPAAIRVGRACGIPVVLDMWENYPEALRMWGRTNWKTRLFKNHRFASAVERYSVRRVSHIITVIEEMRDRLIAQGVPAERISVVTNAVDENLFSNVAAPLDAESGCYKILYVGKLTAERGLDDLIRGAALAAARVPNLRLEIAGDGDDEPRLRRLVAEQGMGAQIQFIGFVPFREIPSHILKSDLCTVPHVASPFIDTTIPNKLFQYMLLGKPVLVSNAKPLARIVRDAGCGFVFRSGDAADVADQIVAAYQARGDATLGARGRQVAREQYTWDKVAPALLRVYDSLLC